MDSKIMYTRDMDKSYEDRKEETKQRQHEMIYASAVDKQHAVLACELHVFCFLVLLDVNRGVLVVCTTNWATPASQKL